MYSLIFLLAAIAVARETRQTRKTIRIDAEIPVLLHHASGVVTRSHTADLSMGGCRIVAPDDRHLDDEIEEIELLLQSGAILIPVKTIATDEESIRLMFDDIPLARRRELVRVVLSRADAWIHPPKPQDNPFRSLGTIMRCVFDLFWLTWKDRRETAVCAPARSRPLPRRRATHETSDNTGCAGRRTLYDAAACRRHLHRVATEIKRAGGDATRAAARRTGIYSIGG